MTQAEEFNPYKELGLESTATPREINEAFRKRVKATHPDRDGGSEEAFERTKRALAVLEDPKKRKRYDTTGVADEKYDEPDNQRAAALHHIEIFVGGAVDSYLNTAENDPRRRHLFVEYIHFALQEIQTCHAEIARGKGVKEFVRDVAQRVKGTEPTRAIEKMFENRMRMVEREIANLEETIEIRNIAIAIARKYTFDTSEAIDIVKPILREPA